MTSLRDPTIINLQPGQIVASRYEICERVGVGGMGMVFRVRDRDLNNEIVALKVLHPHLAQDEQVFRRFLNEVLVARSLSHPNIIRLHDIGRASEGLSYISMEYVAGVTLKDRISPIEGTHSLVQTAQPLPVEEALEILMKIFSGVSYAHEKGIIHRDLKPANVMLSTRGEVKLADFGTARIVGMDTSLTQTGQMIGTPDYMSPEQIRGETLDSRCDVYALGIIAFELLTGRKPFVADSAVAVAFKHLNEPLPSFASETSGVPKWLEEAVRKATAKVKEERYETAADFAQALATNMPELGRQASFFNLGTQFALGSTHRAHAAGTGKPGSETGQHPEFELGTAEKSDTGKWSFGESLGSKRQAKLDWGTSPPPLRRSTSWAAILLTVVFAVICAVVLTVHFNDRLRTAAGRMLSHVSPEWRVPADITAAILGASVERTTKVTALDPPAHESSDTQEAERLALERELLTKSNLIRPKYPENATEQKSGTESDKVTTTEPKRSGEPAKNEEPVAVGSGSAAEPSTTLLPNRPVSAETPAPPVVGAVTAPVTTEPLQISKLETPTTLAPVVTTVTATTAAVPAVPETTGPVPPKLIESTPPQLTAVLTLRERGKREPLRTPSIAQLDRLRVEGVIKGLPERSLEENESGTLSRFSMNVFEGRRARVVTRLKVFRSSISANDRDAITVDADLRGLDDVIQPGMDYRFDLVFNGQVLASRAVNFESDFSHVEVKSRVESGSAEPPAPVIPPVNNSAVTNTDSSLPPVRGPVTTRADTPHFNTAGADTGPAPSFNSEPAGSLPGSIVENSSATVAENFIGSISFSKTDGSIERHAFSMSLQTAGNASTGTAEIDELGTFSVTGKPVARGFEFQLENSAGQIRLSSGKKSRAMRGLASSTFDNPHGTFEASLAH